MFPVVIPANPNLYVVSDHEHKEMIVAWLIDPSGGVPTPITVSGPKPGAKIGERRQFGDSFVGKVAWGGK